MVRTAGAVLGIILFVAFTTFVVATSTVASQYIGPAAGISVAALLITVVASAVFVAYGIAVDELKQTRK